MYSAVLDLKCISRILLLCTCTQNPGPFFSKVAGKQVLNVSQKIIITLDK